MPKSSLTPLTSITDLLSSVFYSISSSKTRRNILNMFYKTCFSLCIYYDIKKIVIWFKIPFIFFSVTNKKTGPSLADYSQGIILGFFTKLLNKDIHIYKTPFWRQDCGLVSMILGKASEWVELIFLIKMWDFTFMIKNHLQQTSPIHFRRINNDNLKKFQS